MNISYAKDNKRRICACCGKKVVKGELYIDDTEVIDGWNNTRKFFAHIQCFIDKLTFLKNKAEKEFNNINFEISRYVE